MEVADFKYGGVGYNFFIKHLQLSSLSELKKLGVRVTRDLLDPKNWPQEKNSRKNLVYQLAIKELLPRMNEIIEHRERFIQKALSAEVALNNLYAFGLVADISRKLKEYKDENNMMLLADAPKFLNGVIQDSDTPFIYEKVGSFYRNYLIDEFQDTSGFQWKNFLPLLTNSLDQGYPGMVVGDVKQAIYRWRGGDLDLLQRQVENQIGKNRTDIQVLNSNYRSSTSIVNFNNAVFENASRNLAMETGHPIASDAYRDVNQKIFQHEEGFVRVKFLDDQEDLSWKDQAFDQIPAYLEDLQSPGISLKDIAILVRRNDEGQQIVAHLIRYKNSEKAKPGFKYDVVSNESLRIDGAASVNLLLSAMRYLLNPDDVIAQGQLSFEFARLHKPNGH